MSTRIKVTIVSTGPGLGVEAHGYRIEKISGAPVISVRSAARRDVDSVGRVGDSITEEQAIDLAKRVDLVTLAAKS